MKINSSTYKVIFYNNNYFSDKIIKCSPRKRITDNFDDLIFSVYIDNNEYIIKRINKHDIDEWDILYDMNKSNITCPYIINYYAGIQSLCNLKRYIVMERGKIDLKDYIRKYMPNLTSDYLLNIINLVFKANLWFIDELQLVYTDLKCRNILVFYDDNPYEYQLKLIDLGLMDDSDDLYDPDDDIILDNDSVNFMLPRNQCEMQQCALFSIPMLIIEILYIYYDKDDSELDGRETDQMINKIFLELDFFKKNPQFSKFLRKLINFHYKNFYSAYQAFKDIFDIKNEI